ncbi:MAG: protein serine/threonine phosphatase 2C family protein [Armatimonadetes bacterium]|nr:protein serine/threonine phosphatase 2C family protein [Armatimonadota bacterium]
MSKGALAFEAAHVSLAGSGHGGENWDAVACLPSPETPEPPSGFDLVAAVADGVSSTPQGGQASRVASAAALRWVQKALSDMPIRRLRDYTDRDFDGLLANAVRRVHDAVVQQAPNGHTTLALACVLGDRLLCANLGDTRIYRWRDGELRQLSEDHRSGQGITRWVGGAHVEPAPALRMNERIRPGDVILLCTDGLLDLYPGGELEELARWASAHPLADVWPSLRADLEGRMRRRASANGYVDDASLVVACVRSSSPEASGRAGERAGPRTAESASGQASERESGEAAAAGGQTRDPSRAPTPPHPHTPAPSHSHPSVQREAPVIETSENTRMATALEELAAAVRLLRTQLSADRDEARARRRPDGAAERGLFRYAMPLTLLVGIALGLGLGSLGGAVRSARPAPREAPPVFRLVLQGTDDLGRVVEESVAGDTYRLTYVTRDGKVRKTLLYWLRGKGQPYGTIAVPLPSSAGESR